MRSQKGFSLVEVMVSMAVLLIGLIVLTGQWPAGTKMIIISAQESEASVISERFLEELEGLDYGTVQRMRSGTRYFQGESGVTFRLDFTISPGPVPNTTEANTVTSWQWLGRPYSVNMGTIVAAQL